MIGLATYTRLRNGLLFPVCRTILELSDFALHYGVNEDLPGNTGQDWRGNREDTAARQVIPPVASKLADCANNRMPKSILHSSRKAIIGSTSIARRAGPRDALSTIAASRTEVSTNVVGSSSLTPYSIDRM